jgi:hypothetical protein
MQKKYRVFSEAFSITVVVFIIMNVVFGWAMIWGFVSTLEVMWLLLYGVVSAPFIFAMIYSKKIMKVSFADNAIVSTAPPKLTIPYDKIKDYGVTRCRAGNLGMANMIFVSLHELSDDELARLWYLKDVISFEHKKNEYDEVVEFLKIKCPDVTPRMLLSDLTL